MIRVTDFLIQVEKIINEAPAYQTRGDGSKGVCDCIGLIIGAIRRAGGEWKGLHGSNYAARNEMVSLEEIGSLNQLAVGEAVYKVRKPGDEKYDLPKSYRKDLNDYYHVGVVVSVNPLRIRHVTYPGGAATDTKIGKWKYHGKLKKIDYAASGGKTGGGGGSRMEETYQAKVKGGTLRMREHPMDGAEVLARIPDTTELTVRNYSDEWAATFYKGNSGYVKREFLVPVGEDDQSRINAALAKIEEALKVIEEQKEIIGQINGRG